MKLVADESIDRQIVESLRASGHDVIYVAELEPGIADNTVLQRANEEQALLVTSDKDFGELTFRQGLIHQGVILVRLAGLSSTTKAEIVAKTLEDRADELVDAFTVISPGHVRIRRASFEPDGE